MTKTFKIGETYSTRSVCDHDCVFEFTVTKRTAKFITIEDRHDRVRRVGVYVAEYDDTERCKPLGTYSMCPVLTA